MGLFSSNKTAFNWVELENSDQLNAFIANSDHVPVLFFDLEFIR